MPESTGNTITNADRRRACVLLAHFLTSPADTDGVNLALDEANDADRVFETLMAVLEAVEDLHPGLRSQEAVRALQGAISQYAAMETDQ